MPKTNNKLQILLPTIFPTDIVLAPFNDAIKETEASGALVPKATIVSPIIIVGILNTLARLLHPLTNISAHFINNINPIKIKK